MTTLTRRGLVQGLAVLSAHTFLGPVLAFCSPCGTRATESARFAPEGEPGQPLAVDGTVYDPSGLRAAAGVTVYAYQTDANGIYGPRDAVPRLRGWMKTDAAGRFRITTIRPAPYPGGKIPAHLHVHLWGGGYEPQWTDDFLFDDDPHLTEAERERSRQLGKFAFIKKVEAGHVAYAIRLKEKGDRFSSNIRHGFDGC